MSSVTIGALVTHIRIFNSMVISQSTCHRGKLDFAEPIFVYNWNETNVCYCIAA